MASLHHISSDHRAWVNQRRRKPILLLATAGRDVCGIQHAADVLGERICGAKKMVMHRLFPPAEHGTARPVQRDSQRLPEQPVVPWPCVRGVVGDRSQTVRGIQSCKGYLPPRSTTEATAWSSDMAQPCCHTTSKVWVSSCARNPAMVRSYSCLSMGSGAATIRSIAAFQAPSRRTALS
jgi:hypothetical protein